jgi:hypothetical protein
MCKATGVPSTNFRLLQGHPAVNFFNPRDDERRSLNSFACVHSRLGCKCNQLAVGKVGLPPLFIVTCSHGDLSPQSCAKCVERFSGEGGDRSRNTKALTGHRTPKSSSTVKSPQVVRS